METLLVRPTRRVYHKGGFILYILCIFIFFDLMADLTEYKSVQASNPVGVLDLSSDFISAEDVTKKSKIFAKKEFTFQISTNRGNQLLQAANEEDRDDWIVRIKEAAAFAVCIYSSPYQQKYNFERTEK